jgi:hypothetical protein
MYSSTVVDGGGAQEKGKKDRIETQFSLLPKKN